MKKIYLVVIVVLVLVIIGAFTYKEETFYSVNGKAEILVTEYNFGEITYLDTINYTFKIKNIGEEPLIISKVFPNNCTIINYDKGIISTNNTSKITTQFIPNKTKLGANKASVFIEGNFNGGVTHLKLKGVINDID